MASFNVTPRGNINVARPIKRVADFDREREEFEMRKRANALKMAAAQQEMAAAPEKRELERKLVEAKIAQADRASSLPAPMQIANKMQELEDVFANPSSDPEDAERARKLYNHLGQAAKTYGFDRGIQRDQAGVPQEIEGFSEATGGIKQTEKRMQTQGAKDVELEMRPKIAAEEVKATERAKTEAKDQEALPKRAGVSQTAQVISGYYDQLEELGSVVSPDNSPLENMAARIQASGAGQFVGGFLGTETQDLFDKIKTSRLALVRDIKNATGMTGKEMDSNVELKLALQAATDPTLSIGANRAALALIDQKYGVGQGLQADPKELQKIKNMFINTPRSKVPSLDELVSTPDEKPVKEQPASSGFKLIRRID